MALGTQGTAAILNPDTMSDTGSGTSSGSDEEGPRERHQAPSKGENGDDPLALFSACVSAWNSGEGEKPESAEETGGEVKRVRKDRRIHRTAEERKQRRLETNRLAAKRAYYRRQGKANAMKDENDRLKMLVEKYEAALMEAGLDPNSIAGDAKRDLEPPARGAKRQTAGTALSTVGPNGVTEEEAQQQHQQQPPPVLVSRSGRVCKPARPMEAPGTLGEPQSLYNLGGQGGAGGNMMYTTDVL